MGIGQVLEIGYSPGGGARTPVEARRRRAILRGQPRVEMERPQRVDFHTIHVGTRGRIRHRVDFDDYLLSAGDALHVRPGQVQQWDAAGDDDGWVVILPPTFWSPALPSWIPGERIRVASLDHELLERVDRLCSELRADVRAFDGSAAAAAVLQGSAQLITGLVHHAAAGPGLPGSSSRAIDRFRSDVENGYARHHDVGHYARSAGLSERTLRRVSVAASGLTPKDYIDRRIMLEARRILAHTDIPVERIAFALGYSAASNFVAAFLRVVGQTPGRFRSSLRGSAG